MLLEDGWKIQSAFQWKKLLTIVRAEKLYAPSYRKSYLSKHYALIFHSYPENKPAGWPGRVTQKSEKLWLSCTATQRIPGRWHRSQKKPAFRARCWQSASATT